MISVSAVRAATDMAVDRDISATGSMVIVIATDMGRSPMGIPLVFRSQNNQFALQPETNRQVTHL